MISGSNGGGGCETIFSSIELRLRSARLDNEALCGDDDCPFSSSLSCAKANESKLSPRRALILSSCNKLPC